jgi:hypothetical protein
LIRAPNRTLEGSGKSADRVKSFRLSNKESCIMNFIKLAVSGGLGASLTLTIYSIGVFLFLYGSVSLSAITPYNLAIGMTFGVLYALVHIAKPPSLASSAVIGLLFAGSLLLLVSLERPLFEITLFSFTSALLMGLVLVVGAFLGVHIGKLSRFNP